MKIEFDMPQGLEEQLKSIVVKATEESIRSYYERHSIKQWMTISEASKYIGVSHNTFAKFRLMGLPVFEVDGVKRVGKSELDDFMRNHSF